MFPEDASILDWFMEVLMQAVNKLGIPSMRAYADDPICFMGCLSLLEKDIKPVTWKVRIVEVRSMSG